jgi:N-acetylglucosaminyl-diphospho-decaprenol L-rhamnosyltransferase
VGRVAVVIVSYNVRAHLQRCLDAFAGSPHEVIVVDSASTDGSPELVQSRFPDVRLIALEENDGYGAAANVAIDAAAGEYFLVMNADAWPIDEAVERLASFADANAGIGVVGPRLLNPDGSLQPSLRGFPTLWRLATEYFFLRWFARRSRLLNAFYGADFDYRGTKDAEFLMGAALLLRRAAVEQVGGFDPDFFMFSEEVDLCYRMRQAGWRVTFFPGAEFVHVGGASTNLDWNPMYREQIRGHLIFLAKHYGLRKAEQARRMLVWAFRMRALVFRGERRRLTRETGHWLASARAAALLERSK